MHVPPERTSAPRPKRKPSQKRVDALCMTHALSTERMKSSAMAPSVVMMHSVWLLPCLQMKKRGIAETLGQTACDRVACDDLNLTSTDVPSQDAVLWACPPQYQYCMQLSQKPGGFMWLSQVAERPL